MKKLLSSEFLSELLKVKVREGFDFDYDTLIYNYDLIKDLDENYQDEISIYEIADKALDWAFAKGFHIIYYNIGKNEVDCYITKLGSINPTDSLIFFYHRENRVKAIFEACKFIKNVGGRI